jgi:hypothetical protein
MEVKGGIFRPSDVMTNHLVSPTVLFLLWELFDRKEHFAHSGPVNLTKASVRDFLQEERDRWNN